MPKEEGRSHSELPFLIRTQGMQSPEASPGVEGMLVSTGAAFSTASPQDRMLCYYNTVLRDRTRPCMEPESQFPSGSVILLCAQSLYQQSCRSYWQNELCSKEIETLAKKQRYLSEKQPPAGHTAASDTKEISPMLPFPSARTSCCWDGQAGSPGTSLTQSHFQGIIYCLDSGLLLSYSTSEHCFSIAEDSCPI